MSDDRDHMAPLSARHLLRSFFWGTSIEYERRREYENAVAERKAFHEMMEMLGKLGAAVAAPWKHGPIVGTLSAIWYGVVFANVLIALAAPFVGLVVFFFFTHMQPVPTWWAGVYLTCATLGVFLKTYEDFGFVQWFASGSYALICVFSLAINFGWST